jgi:hypothetical protein
MRGALRSHLTYSNIVSTICLFLLLGGVAYAASALAPNSVGTKQLKNGAVTLKKIAKQTQSELKAVGPAGPGAPGPAGAKGDPGTAGTPGTNGNNGNNGNNGTNGAPGATFGAVFGSGADGDFTVSGEAVLNHDTYYDNLTLPAGATLNTNGYRLFVAGTLTMNDGSNINRDGLDDENICAGDKLEPHTLGGAGGGGCNGPGEDTVNSLGGDGGSGEGTATPPTADVGGPQIFDSGTQALTGRTLNGVLVQGGAGAFGPSPSAPNGGGGGGVVVVAVRSVTVSGSASITARGGEGLGGGGGGVVVVVSSVPKPAGLTLSAAGGPSGAGPILDGEAGFTEWLN